MMSHCFAVTGAAWHKSGGLNLPDNIVLFYIPSNTTEMNPIEQIWKEIRKRGFNNEVFSALESCRAIVRYYLLFV